MAGGGGSSTCATYAMRGLFARLLRSAATMRKPMRRTSNPSTIGTSGSSGGGDVEGGTGGGEGAAASSSSPPPAVSMICI